MKNIKELLEIRKKAKSKKPEFTRQDTHIIKRIEVKWRKPKGIHSKMRHKVKGKKKMPSPGYKSPSKVRGLHESGLKQVIIKNTAGLDGIDAKVSGVIVGGTVGKRKKIEILKKANELGLKILNIDSDNYLKKAGEELEKKKKLKEKDSEKKSKDKEKKETEKKVKVSKDNKEDAKDIPDEKLKEKKEKDRVLTKKSQSY